MASNHKRPAPARTANGPAAVGTADAPTPGATATAAPAAAVPPSTPAPPGPSSSPPPATEVTQEQARPGGKRPGQGLNITELKDMSIQKLTQIAKDLAVTGATGMRKQELIFQIL